MGVADGSVDAADGDDMKEETKTAIVQPGDRIDILAYRHYGDAAMYQMIINANPDLDLWNPQAGMRIIIVNGRQVT